MTTADRHAYILAATCEGCKVGWPLSPSHRTHRKPGTYQNQWKSVVCTANHALANEVEKWITETIKLAAHTGHAVAFEFLSMGREQRTYSWHDVEDALTKGYKAVRELERAQ